MVIKIRNLIALFQLTNFDKRHKSLQVVVHFIRWQANPPKMNKYRSGFWKSDMNLLCHAFQSMLMLTQDAFDLQGCWQLHNQWTKEYTHSLYLFMKSANQEHRVFFMLYGLIYLSKTLFGILDSECIFLKTQNVINFIGVKMF